jgi:hypothetical protein
MNIHLKAVDKMVRGTEDFSKAMDATLPYHPKSVADFGILTPLSKIFQPYHGDQF